MGDKSSDSSSFKKILEDLYGENPVKPEGSGGAGSAKIPPVSSKDATLRLGEGKAAAASTERLDPNLTRKIPKSPYPDEALRDFTEETFKEQAPRTDLDELEKLNEEAARKPKRSPWSGAQKTQRIVRNPYGAAVERGARGAAERVRSWASRAANVGWKKVGIAGLAGIAIGAFAFFAIDWAINRTQEKIGPPSNLTNLLPSENRVFWISASFLRMTRDEADPYWEPNVFQEAVTINSPYDGVMAFGISLSGVPEIFTNDINVNGLGDGNSDWLCEPFGGYLVCRSLGGYPLEKTSVTVVTMQFHLPAYELKKYLASPSGSRSVYVITPR